MRKILILLALVIVLGGISYVSYRVLAADPPKFAIEVAAPIKSEPKPEPETPELLPDLVPLPAQDLTLQRQDGVTKILFSTTYYNRGRGPLELKADPNSQGVRADHERKVFQRVFYKDGTHKDSLVGTFLWHQEHLHYHYTDFVEYDLIPVSAPSSEDLAGTRIKATFCIRDISEVALDLPNRAKEAGYKICGKETQGVSVGWGDTYYYNYPAQYLDVTGLESGTYRFVQHVNPARRLWESNYVNNTSSILFDLDMEKGTVKMLEQDPKDPPKVEHVHLEDPFGM